MALIEAPQRTLVRRRTKDVSHSWFFVGRRKGSCDGAAFSSSVYCLYEVCRHRSVLRMSGGDAFLFHSDTTSSFLFFAVNSTLQDHNLHSVTAQHSKVTLHILLPCVSRPLSAWERPTQLIVWEFICSPPEKRTASGDGWLIHCCASTSDRIILIDKTKQRKYCGDQCYEYTQDLE